MFDLFLFLLFVVSILTGLFVEAIKKALGDKYDYSSNLLAGIVSVVLSVLVSSGYYVLTDMTFSADLVVYLTALILLSWLCAMIGYDKVIQAIGQIKTKE